jgi:hypothetical protein
MKNPRQRLRQNKGNSDKLREEEKLEPITKFFTAEKSIPKSQAKSCAFDDIPKPCPDVFMLSSPIRLKTPTKVSPPPPIIDSGDIGNIDQKDAYDSDYEESDELIRKTLAMLKKYSEDPDLQEIPLSFDQADKSSQAKKMSKFEQSSASEAEDIPVYASSKMVSYSSRYISETNRSNSQTTIGCYSADETRHTYSFNDSDFVQVPSKQKKKGRSQESPISKIIGDDHTCSTLCKEILSTKKLVLSPNRSPLLKKTTYNDVIHFTQLSQSSQRDMNEIDVTYCKNGPPLDNPIF